MSNEVTERNQIDPEVVRQKVEELIRNFENELKTFSIYQNNTVSGYIFKANWQI